MTIVTTKDSDPYSGDDPSQLAAEIELALDRFGLGRDRRMMAAGTLSFFEGELRLIVRALRLYGTWTGRGPRTVA
jgi:hypothetical protein